MKKVLILTTHFPPSAHVGAKRIAKFCKYLPQYGRTPVVITRKTNQFHLLDETLNDDLPSNLQVYRVGAEGKKKQINSHTKDFGVGINHSGGKPQSYNILKTILIKIYDSLIFYDYLWIIQAFLQARKVIRDNNVKIVFTTFPNAEPLFVGLLLKVFCRIKWVCGFRDTWVLLHCNYKIPIFQRMLEKYIEKQILFKSDHLITVGESLEELLSKFLPKTIKGKISVIYNGYDPDDFVGLGERKTGNNFMMTYLGTWGNRRTPEYFLRALGNLLKENPSMKDRIIVEFIGEVKFDPQLELRIKRIIEEENLHSVVKIIPFMSHRDGLARLRTGDVLLLVERSGQPETDNHWVVTSKLFEYLYLGKSILALIPSKGDAAKIIKRANAGEAVEPADLVGIQEKIYALYCQYIKGELTIKPDSAYIKQFSRVFLTEKLANIFNYFND